MGGGEAVQFVFLEGVTMGKALSKFAASVAGDCGGLTGSNEDGELVAFDPITIATLLTTIWPALTKWLQACRERRQKKQDQQDTPQQHVASIVADPEERTKTIQGMQTRILKVCEDGKKEERRRAKKTGIPADIGRFSIDAQSALRLADKTLTRAANMPAKDAAALCAECGIV